MPAAEADSSLCKGTPSLRVPTSRDQPGRDAVSVTTAPWLKASRHPVRRPSLPRNHPHTVLHVQGFHRIHLDPQPGTDGAMTRHDGRGDRP